MKIISVKSFADSFLASKSATTFTWKGTLSRNLSLRSISPLSTAATSKNAKPFEEIPGRSVLGNILDVLTSGGMKNLTAIQKNKFAKYGPIFKDKIMGKFVVNICDADAIEEVYRAESNFALRPPFDVITESWREFGGILGNDYEAWTKVRHYCNKKMLRPVEVDKHSDDFNDISADLVRRFRRTRQPSGRVNNLELEAMGWSGEIMGKYVYGQRLGFYQEPQNPRIYNFMDASTTFSESLVKVAVGPPIWKYVQTPSYRKLLRSISVLETIGDEFIEIIQRQRRINQNDDCPQSRALFNHFISAGGLTSRQMNAIALGLTQAAFEGTSYTAQWLMYHFSCQPEIQEKAYKEILDTQDSTENISSTSLKKMAFVKACIKEAQRISPTALFISRVTETDLVICGYFIPAGTDLFLFPSLLSRSPKFYDYPLSFDPHRWIDKKLSNPYAYLPFGHGVRMCLGRRVAELMLLIFTVHLIRAFRMTYVGKQQPLPEFRNGVMKPNIPLEIVFQDRK